MQAKSSDQLKQGTEHTKNKQNPENEVGISYHDFSFSYSLNYLENVFNLLREVDNLQNSFDEIDSFARKIQLRENAIDELELIFKEHFISPKRETIFSSWIYDKEDSNSYFVEAYKQLLEDKWKTPKNIQELNHLYEEIIYERNSAFHKKNIKRFHLFRTEKLSLSEPTNFLSDYEGLSSETEIIQEMNFALELFDSSFDIFTKSALFFFFFLHAMPYYNENFFLCKFILSTFFFEKGYTLLALSIGKIMERNKEELKNELLEVLEKEEDLSSFASFFIDLLHDGISSLSFALAKKKYSLKENSQYIGKNDGKLNYYLSLGSLFTSYGLNVFELQKETGLSIPTINRFLKKKKERGNLLQKRIGKRDFFSLK